MLNDVPKTDEEAKIALLRDDDILTNALRGLYRCYRAQGETVLKAFELTLLEHVAAHLTAAEKSRES